jgi:hypothetical protein
MMKLLVSTLGIAFLTAAFSPRAGAQNVLERCNAPISDVETMASRVADCRAWVAAARLAEKANRGPAGPKTPAPVIPKSAPKAPLAQEASHVSPKQFTPAEIAAAAKARALPKLANPIPGIPPAVFISSVIVPMEMTKALQAEPATVERLSLYFAYDAFAAGDAGRCDAMKYVTESSLSCRETVDELTSIRARVGPRAAFIEACVKSPGAAGARLKREQLPAWCQLIADHGDNPAALCPKILPMYAAAGTAPGRAPTAEQCRSYFSALAGDAAECAAMPQEARGDCRSDALFAKAFKGKNASVCAGSLRCRVLMGQGRVVVKEMEPAFTTPAGKWAVKKGWEVKLRLPPPERTPPKPTPTPGDPTVQAPPVVVAPVPTPGDPTVKTPTPEAPKPPQDGKAFATPAPAPFKGFVCADPVWSEANRKAATAAVKAANLCLSDIESVAKPTPELSKGLDERLENLARLTLKMNTVFEPGGAVKKAKAPAKQH